MGLVLATTLGRFLIVLIFSPSNSRIISPDLIPPLSAGPPSDTPPIKAPLGSFKPATEAISFVTSWILTPSHPLLVSPNSINWSIILEA